MLRPLFFCLSLCLGFAFSHAQTNRCGTMEKLEQLTQRNPNLLEKMKQDEILLQQEINRLGIQKGPQHSYPIIPGFEPSGDLEQDAINFGVAKKALIESDSDLYDRLTTRQTPPSPRKPQSK